MIPNSKFNTNRVIQLNRLVFCFFSCSLGSQFEFKDKDESKSRVSLFPQNFHLWVPEAGGFSAAPGQRGWDGHIWDSSAFQWHQGTFALGQKRCRPSSPEKCSGIFCTTCHDKKKYQHFHHFTANSRPVFQNPAEKAVKCPEPPPMPSCLSTIHFVIFIVVQSVLFFCYIMYKWEYFTLNHFTFIKISKKSNTLFWFLSFRSQQEAAAKKFFWYDWIMCKWEKCIDL